MTPNESTPRFFFPRIGAAFIDLSVIYALSVLLRWLVWTIGYLPLDIIFVAVFLGYYLLLHLRFQGRTIGKSLMGLQVIAKDGSPLSTSKAMLLDGFAKTLLGLMVIGYGIARLFPIWSPFLTMLLFLFAILFTLAGMLLFRRPWWERISGSMMVRSSLPREARKKPFRFLLLVTVVALGSIWWPLRHGLSWAKNHYYPEYPLTQEVRTDAAWLKAHAQDPVEYLFGLFRDHDLVVFSERMHPEYTQYQLLTKFVTDPRFIQQVGCIMTETGSVSFQDTLNTYLHTVYPDQQSLDRATADLQRNSNGVWPLWDNTNMFDLLETVNKLNAGSPDSLKIHWHFTDLAVDWRRMDHTKWNDGYHNPLRDSLMAAAVQDCYMHHLPLRHHRKALVIMNTKHGYGKSRVDNPAFSRRLLGTAAYLQDSLPGKVATVLMDHLSIRYGYLFEPVRDGRWDRAFAQNGYQPAAFDFAGSPFGDEPFDLSFIDGKGIRYRDMYDGMIFYTPLEKQFRRTGFPYMLADYEDTMIRRGGFVGPDYQQGMRNQVEYYKTHLDQEVNEDPVAYAVPVNVLVMGVLPVLMLIALGIGAVGRFRIPNSEFRIEQPVADRSISRQYIDLGNRVESTNSEFGIRNPEWPPALAPVAALEYLVRPAVSRSPT